jgi:hypothetical protein
MIVRWSKMNSFLYYITMDYTPPYISTYLDICLVLQECFCVYGQVRMPIIVQHIKQTTDLVEMIGPADRDFHKSYIRAEIKNK